MELFPGCYRKDLENGLSVIGQEEPQSKSVSLGLWFKSGSRDENPEENGITHLLEHLFFRGTENRSAYRITSDVDRLGGHINGSTSREYLLLSLRLLPESLNEGLEILTDLATNPLFREEDFQVEKDVVLEEIRSSRDDHQSETVRLLEETIWGEDSGLSQPVRGTEASLKNLTGNAVESRYGALKHPEEMMLIGAGDMNFEELYDHTGNYLERIVAGEAREDGPTPAEQTGEASGGKTKSERRDINQLHCAIGVEGLAKSDEARYPLEMLNIILGQGMSSRLFRKVRKQHGLAYQVTSTAQYFKDTGFFLVYGAMAPESLDQFVDLVTDELEDLVNNQVGAAELERAKKKTKGNLVLGLENNRSLMGRLGVTELHESEFLSVSEVIERIEAVSPEEIQGVAERLLDRDRLNYALLGPEVEENTVL